MPLHENDIKKSLKFFEAFGYMETHESKYDSMHENLSKMLDTVENLRCFFRFILELGMVKRLPC